MNIAPTCGKCAKPLYDDGSHTYPVDTCTCYKDNQYYEPTGWICPVCGAGVAPFMWQCPNKHFGWSSGGATNEGVKK